MSKRQQALERQQRLRKMQAGLLAVIFVGVLWFQFGGTDKEAKLHVKKRKAAVSSVDTDHEAPEVKARVEHVNLDVDTILASNPFGRPARPVEHQTEIVETKPFMPPKVSAIYKAPSGWVALVDSGVLRTGDFLPGGYRVVDITSDGIKLAPR